MANRKNHCHRTRLHGGNNQKIPRKTQGIHRQKKNSVATTKEETTENPRAKFIETITPIAKKVGESFNIPWQAMVLQAALETGFDFNKRTIFGIKASKSRPHFVSSTHEYRKGKKVKENARFLKIEGATLEEKITKSCIAYCKLMLRAKQYYGRGVEMYQKEGATPREFLEEISVYYTTFPTYAKDLIRIANYRKIDIDTPNEGLK